MNSISIFNLKKESVSEHVFNLFEKSSKLLNEKQQTEFQEFLMEFQDVFADSSDKRGRCNYIKHKIDTGNAKPFKIPRRRILRQYRETAFNLLEDIKNKGVIEPSSSPYPSPPVFIREMHGSFCFYIDYRFLNSITLPLIRSLELIVVEGSQWSPVIDLKSSYWQVQLGPQRIRKRLQFYWEMNYSNLEFFHSACAMHRLISFD